MKRCFLLLLLALIFAASINAQKLVNGGKPQAAKVSSLMDAFCISLSQAGRICKGRDTSTEDGDGKFLIERNNKKMGEISGAIAANGAQTNSFFAFYGDLDKNKSAELIVVDFGGQSNGLGVNYYTINVFPDFQTKGFQEPLSFDTVEFGAEGTFRYDAKTNETLILLTEWGGIEIKDQKRPGGMYFTGRYFRYKNGLLKPAEDKPILARRYLNSFQDERFKTTNSTLRPYNWLSSPTTIKLKSDPIFDEKPVTSESGVIEKFEKKKEKTEVKDGGEAEEVSFSQITVRLDSGARKTVVISNDYKYGDLPESDRVVPETFGILPAKLTLPVDFSPLTIFDKLEGKRVQLNGYKLDAELPLSYKLWFIEK